MIKVERAKIFDRKRLIINDTKKEKVYLFELFKNIHESHLASVLEMNAYDVTS